MYGKWCSSKHGNVNQGAASKDVERTMSHEYQLDVSLGNNFATMAYKQRPSRLVTIKEQFMNNFVTVVTYSHTNWKDYHVLKNNDLGRQVRTPYSVN